KIGLRLTMIIALSASAIGALAVGFAISPKASFLGFLPGLIAVSVGDGVTFTAMFIAASTGVPDRQQGVASGIVSTASGIGAVLWLAGLVLVANLGTDNLDGEPLRAAVAAGVAPGGFTLSCGVLLMLSILVFPAPSRRRSRF